MLYNQGHVWMLERLFFTKTLSYELLSCELVNTTEGAPEEEKPPKSKFYLCLLFVFTNVHSGNNSDKFCGGLTLRDWELHMAANNIIMVSCYYRDMWQEVLWPINNDRVQVFGRRWLITADSTVDHHRPSPAPCDN